MGLKIGLLQIFVDGEEQVLGSSFELDDKRLRSLIEIAPSLGLTLTVPSTQKTRAACGRLVFLDRAELDRALEDSPKGAEVHTLIIQIGKHTISLLEHDGPEAVCSWNHPALQTLISLATTCEGLDLIVNSDLQSSGLVGDLVFSEDVPPWDAEDPK